MRISSLLVLTFGFAVALCTPTDNLPPLISEDAKDHGLLKPRWVEFRSSDDSVLEYVVWPKYGNDMAAISKTEGFLKDLTQQSSIFSYSDSDGDLIVWAVNVTDSQVKAIQGNEGVASIDRNLVIGEKDAAVPVPTEPAKISDAARVKRDIQYTTQSMAGYELNMISQPQ